MADMTQVFDIHQDVAFWCMPPLIQTLLRILVKEGIPTDAICEALAPHNCPDEAGQLKQRDYISLRYLQGLRKYRREDTES